MAKSGPIHITVKVIQVEGEEISLNTLAEEVGKKLYQMSRTGEFKLHERALVSDMTGIRANG